MIRFEPLYHPLSVYSLTVKPLSAIKPSPGFHNEGLRIPLRTVISLSLILPGKTGEINEKPPPGQIPTKHLTVV